MKADPIPQGFSTVTPYITVKGADDMLVFMKKAFDAEEIECTRRPEGTIGNAVVKIGNSMLMFAEARNEWGPMPAGIYLYVEDVDAVYKKALDAGGRTLLEPANMFYGDRNAGVKDSCGNFWWIATHIEDVPPEEMDRRAAEMMKKK